MVPDGSVRVRRAVIGIWIVLAVAGCGGGEMSLAEYVDEINAILASYNVPMMDLVVREQGEDDETDHDIQ